MQKTIHPKYYNDCKVSCTCGNAFTTGSIKPNIDVEICSKCHPFFTGQQKFVDAKGRIDKFKDKLAKSADYHAKKTAKTKTSKKKKLFEKSIS